MTPQNTVKFEIIFSPRSAIALYTNLTIMANDEHPFFLSSAISTLARFHATSYCYFRDRKIQIEEKYPVLLQGSSVPTLSKETIAEINKLFKSNPEYQKHHHFFFGNAEKEEGKCRNSNVKFGVLCQGNFCRDNLLFKYKSNLESRLSCCDIIFQDLSKGHFG